MADFLFRGDLARLDPDVYELTRLEAERQARKLTDPERIDCTTSGA